MPAKAACREIGGTYECSLAVGVVFCMEVRVDQESAALRIENIVEDFEIAYTRSDILGQPTRDTCQLRYRVRYRGEQATDSRRLNVWRNNDEPVSGVVFRSSRIEAPAIFSH